MSDLSDLFYEVRDCCMHDPQWLPEDVDREISWTGDRESGRDTSSIVIVALKNGFFGLFAQSEDYSGHGCVCNSMAVSEPSLGRLMSHLADWEIERVINGE